MPRYLFFHHAEGNDFVLMEFSGQFDANDTTACTNLAVIRDDSTVESREVFTLELTSDDFANVLPSAASLSVTILDNDGE